MHYAANPEAEAGMPDTEEMHVRTRAMLTRIDRERPLVSLFAEPSNLFNPDCIVLFGYSFGHNAKDMLEKNKPTINLVKDKNIIIDVRY